MTAIGILGAGGRMGRAVADVADTLGATVSGGVGRAGAVHGGHPDAAALAQACDVLVDFTAPAALAAHLAAAVAAGTPLLIGTTGLGAEDHAAIDRAAARVAVLPAANTSLGINLVQALVEQAARALGPEWDVEIVEMHHRHKLDAPSGTALLLGAAVAAGRGGGGQDHFDRMTDGSRARAEGGVYYASLRGGSVAGDHQVIFAGEGERIELGHRAEGRAVFARGAVRAALWLAGRPPGRYAMRDVLNG